MNLKEYYLSLDEKTKRLSRADWGACEFTQEDFDSLAHHVIFGQCEAGEIIFRKGDREKFMIILDHGVVEVLLNDPGDPDHITATVNRGMLGEMALIEDSPRSATIRAKTDTTIFILTQEAFSRLKKEHSPIWGVLSSHIAHTLSQRLRLSNARAVSTLIKTEETLTTVHRRQPLLTLRRGLSLAGLGGIVIALWLLQGPKLTGFIPTVSQDLTQRLQSEGEKSPETPPADHAPLEKTSMGKTSGPTKTNESAKPFDRKNYFQEHVMNTFDKNTPLKINFIPMSLDAVIEGKKLYMTHCKSCHGSDGRGYDIMTSPVPIPRPANLSYSGDGILHKDAYLFWSIAEGGTQFGTTMPAFKPTLTDESIWKVVLFLGTFR